MAVLEDCPDEILLEVISHVHRSRDLSSLKLVSHRLHRLVLVSPSLLYSMSYSNIKCGHSPFDFRHTLYTTLVSILKFPERALYVETINLRWDYRLSEDYFELADEDAAHLLELIFEKTGILEWEDGKELVGALRERKQKAYVVLLLLLLGNLEELSINMARDDLWVLWAMRKVVSSCFLPPSLSTGLRSLRRIDINRSATYKTRPVDRISLSNIVPFLLLPSIDKIEALYLTHYLDFIEYDGCFHSEEIYGASSVTSLCLYRSVISPDALAEILRIPKGLKKLSLK